jgi:HAD superfamily hydrolase (TIGR01509 family)
MSSPIRAVSLDLDGTLYPVGRLRVAWRLRHERGLLLAFMAARERIRHETPFDDADALLERETELVAPSFELEHEQAKLRIRALKEALPEALTRGVRPYPGVKSALEGAHVRGLKLAIVSDYAPIEKLRWLGLDDLPWSATIGCDLLGALKPHPRAFLEVAERLEVEPSSVLHIGDREDLDVQGALSAGLRAWRFSRRRGTTSRAERVFGEWGMSLFGAIAG